MAKAARAIIVKNDRILVMHRNNEGSEYYTLVGGRVSGNETLEECVIREVKEETRLDVTSTRLVYSEDHPEPYNDQYIYLCEIEGEDEVQLGEYSEEKMLNGWQTNIHTPRWVPIASFDNLAFRTPQLQEAIIKGLKKGFPKEPVAL